MPTSNSIRAKSYTTRSIVTSSDYQSPLIDKEVLGRYHSRRSFRSYCDVSLHGVGSCPPQALPTRKDLEWTSGAIEKRFSNPNEQGKTKSQPLLWSLAKETAFFIDTWLLDHGFTDRGESLSSREQKESAVTEILKEGAYESS